MQNALLLETLALMDVYESLEKHQRVRCPYISTVALNPFEESDEVVRNVSISLVDSDGEEHCILFNHPVGNA
jgi:hypothetical protein